MSIKLGRTIGERREKLETASERAAAHKKNEKKRRFRLIFTIIGFVIIVALIAGFAALFINSNREIESVNESSPAALYKPSIEIIDEDAAAAAGGGVTSRMKEYIGQAEADFRELGYTPVKAVIPRGSIREVDFYLDGHKGFIKLIIDRPTGVSVEDADRMLRYLASINVSDFTYIDVRIDGKAYWK